MAGLHLQRPGLRKAPSRRDAFHSKDGELAVSMGILRITRDARNGTQLLGNWFRTEANLQDGDHEPLSWRPYPSVVPSQTESGLACMTNRLWGKWQCVTFEVRSPKSIAASALGAFVLGEASPHAVRTLKPSCREALTFRWPDGASENNLGPS